MTSTRTRRFSSLRSRPRASASTYVFACVLSLALSSTVPVDAAEIRGELAQWHKVELWFRGPQKSETDSAPNPFLDYRLQCRFTAPSGTTLDVPGFFDGDGYGGPSGNVWKCRLGPDEIGTWKYVASFRGGSEVAVSLAPNAGAPLAFNGDNGTFEVSASTKQSPDFRSPNRGRIEYTGEPYLRFAGSDRAWIKIGVNIPENFLGYAGFDNTPAAGHAFAPHVKDWKPGDPTWNGDAGKGIIGALNYLASKGANSIYVMPMTIGGDSNDTFPTVAPLNKTHYDTSKLLQWEETFAHCDRLGIFLHLQLSETEPANETYHDKGELGPQRKLYYREPIARFAHHLGVEWDVGEESDYGAARNSAFARRLNDLSPYDQPVSVHTRVSRFDETYAPLLGDSSIQMTAWQGGRDLIARIVEWRERSAAAGQPWVVSLDEPTKIENDPADTIAGYPFGRTHYLWPFFMAGGAGFEWYVQEDGGGHGFDQRIEDFRSMESALLWSGYARSFFERLPLADMHALPAPENTLSVPGRIYALYSPDGKAMSVDLSNTAGEFAVRWYSPTGGFWRDGASMTGGGKRNLGTPPFSGDAAALVVSASKIGCGTDADCADDEPCTSERCDLEEGCVSTPVPDATSCDDLDPCTADDSCTAGACGGTFVCGTEPGCKTDAECGDGDACNGQEQCVAGSCTQGSVLACDDADPCTEDGCEATGGCINVALTCPAATACDSQTGTCRTISLVCYSAARAPTLDLDGNMRKGADFTGGADDDPAANNLSTPLLFADSAVNSWTGGSDDDAIYAVALPDWGPWWLWGRFYYPGAPGSNDANSFFVRVDRAKRMKFGNNRELFRRWHWDGDGDFETGSPRGLDLGRISPLSTHRLIIEKREVLPAGMQPRLDTFCFTRDGSTPPDDVEVRTLLGTAAGCSSPTDCDDANACTTDACDIGLGDCSHAEIECDDADPCTIDVCDEAFGCGALTLPDGASCASRAP